MIKLDRVSKEQLHRTFLEAFSDYAMDASRVTEESLLARAAKNAVDFDLSVGAFDDGRMVGFVLIGVDLWQGGLAAFDAGTGIVPEFRGEGLAKRMFDHALPGLRARGVTRFLLEVLKENERAIRAYRKAGFKTTREFACYALPFESLAAPAPGGRAATVRAIDRSRVRSLVGEADWQPSWENSFSSIERARDELVTLGAFRGETLVGILAYSPILNWILTIVVERSERRKGIGAALVRSLVDGLREKRKSVQVTNIDTSDSGMLAFFERLGFKHWVDQYEMECLIHGDASG
jgi:ribosomal protein S18 acetylase RimI-like enzyme